MNTARERMTISLTHRFASEINRALADSGMTIRELAEKIGDSEGYIRRVLEGEDGVADVVKLRLISDIAWATGQWLSLSVSPTPTIKTENDVQPGDTK